MKTRTPLITILVFCGMLLGAAMSEASDVIVTPRAQAAITRSTADAELKVWVYFIDKDRSNRAFAKAAVLVSGRAAARRAEIPLDDFDIPVRSDYVDAVTATGARQVRASRWLNAVSARVTPAQMAALADLPFVSRIDLVQAAFRSPLPKPEVPEFVPALDSADYGTSFSQNHLILADSAHTLGLDGAGVLIAFFDTGFLTSHPAFAATSIIDTYDFINDDPYVDDAVPTVSQLDHGTATFSACGAYVPGELIGPAYGADYLLAKTEISSSEIIIEEDNWVLAAEWADSLGADIISSSLGYTDWYAYADMDGNTALTTIAADIAASRGILVVNSVGNEFNKPWRYLIAPSDGDSVLAVGAVDASGVITSFSSVGPSSDGRVKPEVVAMGSSVRCANSYGGYTYKSGTSLSAPLVAGMAAQILQANPNLSGNPMGIRQRIIESADRYPNFDSQYRYGYGVPNVVVAAKAMRLNSLPIIYVTAYDEAEATVTTTAPEDLVITLSGVALPSSFSFADNGDGTGLLTVYGDPARLGPVNYQIAATAGALVDTLTVTVVTTEASVPFVFGPNPFEETLTFNLTRDLVSGYDIEIFSLSGELVYRTHQSGAQFVWPAVNQYDEKVAAGVYIIRFSADGIEEKVKVMKL